MEALLGPPKDVDIPVFMKCMTSFLERNNVKAADFTIVEGINVQTLKQRLYITDFLDFHYVDAEVNETNQDSLCLVVTV